MMLSGLCTCEEFTKSLVKSGDLRHDAVFRSVCSSVYRWPIRFLIHRYVAAPGAEWGRIVSTNQYNFMMSQPGQTGKLRHNVLSPSVHSFVCYQIYERDILKTNEPTSMPIDTSDPRGKDMKRPLWVSGGQRSRSYEAKDRSGGLAEASLSTHLGRVDFLVNTALYNVMSGDIHVGRK